MNRIRAFAYLSICLSSIAFSAESQVPDAGFLCCNMRTDGSWVTDINYAESGKRIIPYGTPVKFLGLGRYRVHVEVDGRRQSIGNDYSRDLTMEAFARRYIVAKNPRDDIASSDAKIRSAIETARVTRGMTKDQVTMALGYPVSSENPNLDVRRWRFWLWSFSPFTVHFGEAGLVSHVETDPDTLLKVYME